jgi:regulator of sigma E protease
LQSQNGLYDGSVVDLGEVFSQEKISMITNVVYGSPAETAGLMEGDKVLSINGVDIYKAADVVKTTSTITDDTLQYVVERAGEVIELTVGRDENGLVGVYVADIYDGVGNGVSVYETVLPTSVMEIKPVQYGFFKSFSASWHEMGRLSVLTFGMIKDFIGQLFTEGTVPENISGPVGIAQMTYVFLQEGFASLVRFTALLSLGLATFNIIPFPGLDGGRFAFLAYEAITGRKPHKKVEAMFHSVGFMLLMLLMIVVTYKDIVRIVVGG